MNGVQLNKLNVFKPPEDRYNIVYWIFVLNGIGVLLPWNMFITAQNYFIEYKFSETYIGENFTLATDFMQYLTFADQGPNVVFTWLNLFIHLTGGLNLRIMVGLSCICTVFLLTIILAMVNTSSWPYAFFGITMACVAVLNANNAVYQNSLHGLAAKLPYKYTGAILLGNMICGTFTSIVDLTSLSAADNYRAAAIYYFITALFTVLVCLNSVFALPLNRYYSYCVQRYDKIESSSDDKKNKMKIPYWYIIKKSAPQLYNCFMVFFVSLTVFPSIASNIKPTTWDGLGKYYASLTVFLTYNVTAMLGSILAVRIQWPKPKWLWIPVTIRIIYIPFFLFCQYNPPNVNRTLPVLVQNDLICWIVSVTHGLTAGYFTTVALMYSPGTVEEKYSSTAGMFGEAFLITGIVAGVMLSFLWPAVI